MPLHHTPSSETTAAASTKHILRLLDSNLMKQARTTALPATAPLGERLELAALQLALRVLDLKNHPLHPYTYDEMAALMKTVSPSTLQRAAQRTLALSPRVFYQLHEALTRLETLEELPTPLQTDPYAS